MTTTVPPERYVSRLAVEPVNERRVLTSEWLKLTTLRSSWITMALGIGALAFLGGVIGFFTNQQWDRLRVRDRLRSARAVVMQHRWHQNR